MKVILNSKFHWVIVGKCHLKFGVLWTIVGDSTDDDDDNLLTLWGKRKGKADLALSKVEQEIKELEIFSNTSAFSSPSLGALTIRSMRSDAKRLRINKWMKLCSCIEGIVDSVKWFDDQKNISFAVSLNLQ